MFAKLIHRITACFEADPARETWPEPRRQIHLVTAQFRGTSLCGCVYVAEPSHDGGESSFSR
jgi:hypothetical protein